MIRWLALLLAASAVGFSEPIATERPLAPHRPLRGTDFPDGVLALTWDDGPDVHTLELARFLHDQHVRATFFAVAAWVDGVSEEPGVGDRKFETGYDAIPILADVVRLGHRIGSHTKNHVLLGHATPALAKAQLTGPFLGTELHLFRAPAGWWTDASIAATADDTDLVGPIHWDIDGKDWECSLYCRSDAPATECEPSPVPNEQRVRAGVIADRYFAQIQSAKHGIVLMHDRVGAVGSTYALDLAHALIPRLIAAHYVFVAPVLRFAPPAPRAYVATHAHRGDLNGDGLEDECTSTPRGVACALFDGEAFKQPSVWLAGPVAGDFSLVDVNHDGRADLCFADRCAVAP